MANEVRKITLTQLGTDPGPNFSIQYSTDCITYTQSLDCTNVFLPSVGSFAYCTVDENTTCVRLTSLTPECGNQIIDDLRPTTTTTSTTSTTTTSTTTTAAPTTTTTSTTSTTTTTTTLPPGPQDWYAEACPGQVVSGNTFPESIKDLTGLLQVGDVGKVDLSYLGLGEICFTLTGIAVDSANLGDIESSFVDCDTCLNPPTTTTTLAPTTTTTLAPTTTTTTTAGPTTTTTTSTTTTLAPKNWNSTYCPDQSQSGSVELRDLTGTLTSGSVVKFVAGGNTFCATLVSEKSPFIFYTITESGFLDCPSCTGATTTTTTTLAPTTTTTAAPFFYYNAINCQTGAGTNIRSLTPLSIGNIVKINAFNACYEITSVGGVFGFDYDSVFPDCPTCVGTLPTTTTTTTAGPEYLFYTGSRCSNGAPTPIRSTTPLTIGNVVKTTLVDPCVEIVSVGGTFGFDYTDVFPNCVDCQATVPTTTTTSTTTTTTLAPTTTTTSTTSTTTTSTTSTTTLAPTTTTTTLVQGYYRAYLCINPLDKVNSILYPQGTFNIGDRIIGNGFTAVIEAFVMNDPGGNLYPFTPTGETGCPATTTTTTSTTTTTTTLAPTTTTTTAAPTTTTTTAPCLDCYVYEVENTNATGSVGMGGILCNGPDTWSFSVVAQTTEFTPCTQEFSIEDIDSYIELGLIFLSSGSCGNSCIPTTTTTTAAPAYCYTLETVQSAPGECFDCPGFFASTTDTIMKIFTECSGSEIFPPFDINVESRYSDNSTSSLFIPMGYTESIIIATSDVQCAPLPSCGEIASPTFVSASITSTTGSITECCV